MATKTRTKKTRRDPAQKKAEMEALHQQLADGVEALRTSQQWSAYLAFCASFHRYSINNLLLIMAQRPQAEQVAGYRAWQAKGRQVRKGEQSIRILGTGTVKVTEEDEETGEVIDGKRRVYFSVSVFDIAQTDLMDGHEDTSTIAHHLTGEDESGIYAQVVEHLSGNGVTVERKQVQGGTNGYTYRDGEDGPICVVIDQDLSPAQAAKTALHEAAHIELGHLDDDYAEYVTHRGRYEVEAEAVAYVLAGILGLDSSTYSTGYVAGWAERAEGDVIKDTAGCVLAAVHTLAEALDTTSEDAAEEDAA
ncbi:MAG: ArdC-like ssDNA-binding domain-containing protein [Ornithinimicrobium sp.]